MIQSLAGGGGEPGRADHQGGEMGLGQDCGEAGSGRLLIISYISCFPIKHPSSSAPVGYGGGLQPVVQPLLQVRPLLQLQL